MEIATCVWSLVIRAFQIVTELVFGSMKVLVTVRVMQNVAKMNTV